jgi:hypothetical protein
VRAFTVALLLVLLPSLLLPAGLSLHLCRCEPTARPHACCSDAADPPAADPPAAEDREASSCCNHGRARVPLPAVPVAAADDCGCVWVPLPDDRTEQDRAETPLALPGGHRNALAALPPGAARGRPCRRPEARLRAPPDHQRSLPLRL